MATNTIQYDRWLLNPRVFWTLTYTSLYEVISLIFIRHYHKNLTYLQILNDITIKWLNEYLLTHTHIVQNIINRMWSLELEISGNLSMGIMSEQCCWRSDPVSLLVISAFQRLTLPSKHYEILAQRHSVTPQNTLVFNTPIILWTLILAACDCFLLRSKCSSTIMPEFLVDRIVLYVMSKRTITCKAAHLTVGQFTHTATSVPIRNYTQNNYAHFNVNFCVMKCQNTRFEASMLIKIDVMVFLGYDTVQSGGW